MNQVVAATEDSVDDSRSTSADPAIGIDPSGRRAATPKDPSGHSRTCSTWTSPHLAEAATVDAPM
jgi:hypothetical protein